jgi:hypothetical protein
MCLVVTRCNPVLLTVAGEVEMSVLGKILRELASDPEAREAIREMVQLFRDELMVANGGDEWSDQRSAKCRATLGRNVWCRAVKERIARDPEDTHARIVGADSRRRYLLDTVGLSEELSRASQKPVIAKVSPAPTSDPAESPHVARVLSLLGRRQ